MALSTNTVPVLVQLLQGRTCSELMEMGTARASQQH